MKIRNDLKVYVCFMFLLISLFAITINTYSMNCNGCIISQEIPSNDLLLTNGNYDKKYKMEFNDKFSKSILNYSDYKIYLNLGNFNFFQRLPRSIEDSLGLLQGDFDLPLGFSFEVDTKIGKIKTEMEGIQKLNSLRISNNFGLASLYYDFDTQQDLFSNSESKIGLSLNLDF